MPWVRIDEEMTEHPKVASAGPVALAHHIAGLCYCNRNLTDGFIPERVARHLLDWSGVGVFGVPTNGEKPLAGPGWDVDGELAVGLLVDSGMWHRVGGGYRIHDYLDYQPSKAQVEADRKQKAEAGRLGGKQTQRRRRAETSPSEATASAAAQAPAEAFAEAGAQAELKPDPVPEPLGSGSGSELATPASPSPPPQQEGASAPTPPGAVRFACEYVYEGGIACGQSFATIDGLRAHQDALDHGPLVETRSEGATF
jgi:hypothetical protein